MKKLLSFVILAAILVMSLVSCGGVGSFQEAINNTDPTRITITTKTVVSSETLSETFDGSYVIVYAEDGSATVEYSYEVAIPLDITNPSAETKQKISGTVERKADGTYTDGGEISGTVDAVAGVAIDLSAISGDAVEISESGYTLTATVAKADTEAVFGVAYDFDVTLKIVKGDTVVETVEITYAGANTTTTIKCVYQ